MSAALLSPRTVSPEAIAIIKEGTPKPQTPLVLPVVTPTMPDSMEGGDVPAPKPAAKVAVMPKTKPQKSQVEEMPNLVAFSIRLPASLPRTLLKAASERKLRRKEPYTNQGIVAEALNDWFGKHGYQE